MFNDPFRSQNARQQMKKACLGRRYGDLQVQSVFKTIFHVLDARNSRRSTNRWMMQPTKTGTFLRR
jgi:hypothetical protein